MEGGKLQWGTELWDKYSDLCTHASSGLEFLDSSVASFVKERGKIEFEYAKSLRTLIKKYTPKETIPPAPADKKPDKKPDKNASNGSGPMSIMSIAAPAEEEYSHMKSFKQVRSENFQTFCHLSIPL